jgi:hypothetical protein
MEQAEAQVPDTSRSLERMRERVSHYDNAKQLWCQCKPKTHEGSSCCESGMCDRKTCPVTPHDDHWVPRTPLWTAVGCRHMLREPKARRGLESARADGMEDGMKRFRILGFDFDSRVQTLTLHIQDEWAEQVKEQHRRNKALVEQGLVEEFGALASGAKRQNFIDLGPKPFSVLAYHNEFLQEIRVAFVVGAYYPALTAACALGERILNHLILTLREDYRATPEYKRVYDKDTFDKWDMAIDTLVAWDVLLSPVAAELRRLRDHRTAAIHFRPELDEDARPLALAAIQSLSIVIGTQFSAFGNAPWFITGVPGEAYLRKDWEDQPFVRAVYLPNCLRVGPRHRIQSLMPLQVTDEEYEPREISDQEFCTLRRAQSSGQTPRR